MRFATLSLELDSPLHIGAGWGGMLARSHGFVPGHVLGYALAAVMGAALGGRGEHYAAALTAVRQTLRCGPLLLQDPDGRLLYPRRDRRRIEERFLAASNHVALHPGRRSAVEGALYEMEAIAPRVLYGQDRGGITALRGGVWFADDRLAGRSLPEWFPGLRLGGELKAGLGRVRLADWSPDAASYAGLGAVDGRGLRLPPGGILPGPALDGVTDAPLLPWLGRLYDPGKGFGQRFSPPAMVRLDGRSPGGGFLPAAAEAGMGCWTQADA